jgi:hypothetical protein
MYGYVKKQKIGKINIVIISQNRYHTIIYVGLKFLILSFINDS